MISFDLMLCSYDPAVSVEMAWKIDGKSVKRVDNIRSVASVADYVSVHVPFIEGVTENLISEDFFMHMKVRTLPLAFECDCWSRKFERNIFHLCSLVANDAHS